jgi:hypothetical protein
MTRDEAMTLAAHVVQVWPRGGIATDVWAEELGKLDSARARAALAELKRSEDHSPSLARFYARYTAHAPVARHVECSRCEGSGWLEVADARRHGPRCADRSGVYGEPGDCHCSAMEPCQCAAGESLAATHERIVSRSAVPR